MGIFTALYSGVNGINSNGQVISVVGDNISNVNTTGFKGGQAQFEDILAGQEMNVGLGSRISDIQTQYTQGGFESTGSVTDLAIDGNGFFMVKSPGGDYTYYTRAGQFAVNNDGYLVNAGGERLQGYQTDAANELTSNVDDIMISNEAVSPKATDQVNIAMNLDANSEDPGAFDVTDPTGTSNFSAGVTVYDSLGNSHLITVYFSKTAANTWDWNAVATQAELDGGGAGLEVEANGTLLFDNTGALDTIETSTTNFDFLGAVQDQSITFDFGTTTTTGTGLDGATQFGSNSTITNITQTGYTSGTLQSIEFASDGTITGNYTNGTPRTLAQVVLARFQAEGGLKRMGGNNFAATLDSGAALIAAPGNGGRGNILSATLEQSNVDVANELIKMMIIQRGFQANARTISAVNDMLAQLVNIGQ